MQEVRKSIAVLFETAMGGHGNDVVLSTMEAMRAVLKVNGVSPKQVSDWILEGPKVAAQPAKPVAYDGTEPVRKKWKPSAEASLPTRGSVAVTKEYAVDVGSAYIESLLHAYGSAMTEKERDFLTSVIHRFSDSGRWITVKQERWINTIAARFGCPSIADAA